MFGDQPGHPIEQPRQMRCDAAFGVLKRLAVAQANEGEELIKLSVAVDGERAASKRSESECFLRDDRRENDAHRDKANPPTRSGGVESTRDS